MPKNETVTQIQTLRSRITKAEANLKRWKAREKELVAQLKSEKSDLDKALKEIG